jgi:hypothetical protein
MPLLTVIRRKITFSLEEAVKLTAYMEQVGDYSGHKMGKTAFDMMRDYEVLDIFEKLREIIIAEYEDKKRNRHM